MADIKTDAAQPPSLSVHHGKAASVFYLKACGVEALGTPLEPHRGVTGPQPAA